MDRSGTAELKIEDGNQQAGYGRYVPITIVAAGALAALIFGGKYLNFQTLADNYRSLIAWRDGHLVLTVAVYMAVYMAAVAFSVPGAVWLTLVGGFLFGVVAGSAIVVVSATLGAMGIFLAAKTALGDTLRRKAGGWIRRMEEGFREGEVSFLLIMRLVPAVPFFIANIAPAFLGARTLTFLWTTLVGIIPGTIVYISIGAGLGEQLALGEAPDLGVIFEWHILGPLLGLAALASLPLLLKATGLMRKKP